MVGKSLPRRIWGIRQAGSRLSLLWYRLGGSPVPPPHPIKLYWLDCFRRAYCVEILIETGTYQGTTVEAMLEKFKQICTIELDPELWKIMHDKFSRYSHVRVIQGNSGHVLPAILASVSQRCLFWLDGHFSGPGTARGAVDSPIAKELDAIRSHHRNDHIILVDDARLFDGNNGYLTLEEIHSRLKEINPSYHVRVVDDIIQAYLPKPHRVG